MLLYNLLSLFGFVYAFTAIAISFVSFSQSWLSTSDPHVLSFRKPRLMRLGMGMFSLLAPGGMWLIATAPSSDPVLMWCFFGPLFVAVFCLLVYLAGPQDVSIDLDGKTCHETRGWPFAPRRRTCPLTNQSSLRVSVGGSSWYVTLWIGVENDPGFLLARPNSRTYAVIFAQEMAEKLHLPVMETTPVGVRRLS